MPDDLGLTALLEAARRVAQSVSEEVLRGAYAVQVEHQFDKDRELALAELKRLVEAALENQRP
jgi:hypothetical protein